MFTSHPLLPLGPHLRCQVHSNTWFCCVYSTMWHGASWLSILENFQFLWCWLINCGNQIMDKRLCTDLYQFGVKYLVNFWWIVWWLWPVKMCCHENQQVLTDPLHVLVVPITRARSKKIKEALNGLILTQNIPSLAQRKCERPWKLGALKKEILVLLRAPPFFDKWCGVATYFLYQKKKKK